MILVNGNEAIGEGPGVTFDPLRLMALGTIPGKKASMADLLRRISPRVVGLVRNCLVPDQTYIDLHWEWSGYIRRGSPICDFNGKEKHVALCLWSLWQNVPFVLDGPVRRLCKWEGCCNPHHYLFPTPPTPAQMTFSLTGDPGEEAEAAMLESAQRVKDILNQPSEPTREPTDQDWLNWWLAQDQAYRESIEKFEPEKFERFESLRNKLHPVEK